MHPRRNLARLDLAATTPEHIRVVHRDADAREVRVDCRLVREHAFLLRAVADGHDVHVVEIRPALAPVAVREDRVPPHFAARLDLATRGHTPVEERVEFRHTLSGRARLHVLEESGEASDDLALVQILRHAAERLQIHARLRRARRPQARADFVEREFAFQREEDFPFEIGQLHDADGDHLRALLGLVTGLNDLAPHMPHAEREDSLRRHELEFRATRVAHEHPRVLLHVRAGRRF